MGDSGRRLLSANAAARRLLDPEDSSPPLAAPTCCDAFGCRRSDGPLAESCLTEIAQAAEGGPVPEIRVDLPGEGDAAWITVATIPGDWVMFHLRPGHRGDRRRRTDPHWLGGRLLTIHTFGKLRVASAEGAIGGQWMEQRPGQILKYLVSQRSRTVPVDELAEAFWPGPESSGLVNVRYAVHQLRDRLEPDREKRAPSSFIVARNGGYALDRSSVRIDANEFEQAARAGLAAAREGEQSAVGDLRRAALLYTGEFIADEPYSDWILEERDRLHDLAVRSLRALVDLARERGDIEAMTRAVRRQAELNPYDTDAQRQLITLMLREGRRSEAVRRYHALRSRLRRQFGEEPEFDLATLSSAARQEGPIPRPTPVDEPLR